MNETLDCALAYFRQQAELGVPDYIFSRRASDILEDFTASTSASATSDNAINFSSKTMTAPPKTSDLPTGVAKQQSAPLANQGREALVALYKKWVGCTACGLGRDRKNFVFGAGNAQAKIMVIGEAPGIEEDVQGEPFVGAVGELLTKMLVAIKLDRKKDLFITNVLKCKPPQGRSPEDNEVCACRALIQNQIEIIAPRVILLLGRVAAHTLLATTDTIGRLRFQAHQYKGIPVRITYHPAALLRNADLKRPAWEDLKKFERLCIELGAI